jgi:hypothetical protein
MLVENWGIMKYRLVLVVGLYLFCAQCSLVFAQVNKDAWLNEEKSVRAAIDAGRINDASLLAIKVLQRFEQHPVAEDDPNLERFYIFDLGDILAGNHDPTDRMTMSKWEYSTTQKVWGKHSVPYVFALNSMSSSNKLLTKQFGATDEYVVEEAKLRDELNKGPKAALLRDWTKSFWDQLKLSLNRSSDTLKQASKVMDNASQRSNQIRAELQKQLRSVQSPHN